MIKPVKNLIFAEKPEISLKVGLFEVGKQLVPLMCYFWVYIMHHSCLYDSEKNKCFRKSLSQVVNENALGQSDCKIF